MRPRSKNSELRIICYQKLNIGLDWSLDGSVEMKDKNRQIEATRGYVKNGTHYCRVAYLASIENIRKWSSTQRHLVAAASNEFQRSDE